MPIVFANFLFFQKRLRRRNTYQYSFILIVRILEVNSIGHLDQGKHLYLPMAQGKTCAQKICTDHYQ